MSEEDGDILPSILVVDDAKENIKLLSGLLKEQGRVIFALDGPSALEKVKQSNPDLILLDIEMPGMSGFDVLKALQETQALGTTPVIFVTGRNNETDEEEGLKLGAVDYITKPFNPTIVLTRVRNQLLLRYYKLSLERANNALERLGNIDRSTDA